MNMKLLISIPAYNEEKNLKSTIEAVNKSGKLHSFDILVVNDGSKDKTELVAKNCGVAVVSHPYNMGYGVAIQTGYKYALENGYEFLSQIDADGQHDPKYIWKMLELLNKNKLDLVIGSRFKDHTGYKAPVLRRLGMIVFSCIVGFITKRKVTDSTSGYQVMRRSVLKFLTTDSFPCDYPDADLLIMLHYAGFKVDEFSMVMHESNTGKSMHSGLVKNIYYVFKMNLSIFTILLRRLTGLKSF